jgi:hypothetical protein
MLAPHFTIVNPSVLLLKIRQSTWVHFWVHNLNNKSENRINKWDTLGHLYGELKWYDMEDRDATMKSASIVHFILFFAVV